MRKITLLLMCLVPSLAVAKTFVYVGTYTNGKSSSEGIYVSVLDESTGELSEPSLAARVVNPSFVAIHPNQPRLYCVSEIAENGLDSAGVFAFSIGDDGRLTRLNDRSTRGAGACHLAIDPTGQCVGVANYGGGSCASYPIRANGLIGELGSFHQHVGGSRANSKRQNEPHAHSLNFNSDGTQAFVADLGKDRILVYDVDPTSGTMKPSTTSSLELPPGGGPRHFCFHPSYEYAFSNLEMTSQVALLKYNQDQRSLSFHSVQTTLPKNDRTAGNSTAECLVHPNGNFIYVSNRGHNSIAGFAFDASGETLTPIGHWPSGGEIPRGFGIDPSGRYLLAGNQRTGNVVSFQIDASSGKLTPTGHQIKVDAAVNVRFFVR